MNNKTNLFSSNENLDLNKGENKLIDYYLNLREVENVRFHKESNESEVPNAYDRLLTVREQNKRINKIRQDMSERGYSEKVLRVLRFKEECLRYKGRYSEENMRTEMVIDILETNQVIALIDKEAEIDRNDKNGVPYLEELDIYEDLWRGIVCIDKLRKYLEEVYAKEGSKLFLLNTEYYSTMEGILNDSYFASYSNVVFLDRSIWGGELLLLMTIEELKEELERALMCSRKYHMGKLYVETCDRGLGEFPKEYCELLKNLKASSLEFYINTLYSTITMLEYSGVHSENIKDIMSLEVVKEYADKVKMEDIVPENNPYRYLIEWQKGVCREHNII